MNDLKCFIGMHRLTLKNEEPITDSRGETIGKAYVSVCQNCGKIKIVKVELVVK